MLLGFTCKNFRSFKEEASFSMLPVNAYKEHPENIIPKQVTGSNTDGVLSAAAIYGTNASGKTNLLRAIDYARILILEGIHPAHPLKEEHFIGNNEPIGFHFSFLANNQRYEYEFAFDADGVETEELKTRPKGERLVFRRSRLEDGKYNVKQGSKYPGITAKLKGYSDNGLVLGMLSRYGVEPCLEAFGWFNTGLSVINREKPAEYGEILEKLTNLGQNNFKKIISAIKAADLGIMDAQLNVDEMTEDEQAAQKEAADRLSAVFEALTGQKPDGLQLPNKKIALQFRHVIDGQGVGFSFEDESLGTITMLDLAADLISAIDSGRTLLVDEAERSLHPVLLKNLVELFSNKAMNDEGAQLIFTTHDLSFLSNDLLRRDQIWFVQKDPNTGASDLYPLSSFSPRKDESLTNRYLHGAYGAVPFIEGLDSNG